MKSFYRYVRPTHFNEKRLEIETSKRGGVCLRFNQNDDGSLWFSYARCHEKDLFSKGVAKQIADERSATAGYIWASWCLQYLDFSQETDKLVQRVIDFCRELSDVGEEEPMMFYFKQELHNLKVDLQNIIEQNKKTKERAQIWYDGIAAAKHKESYEYF